jgi:hypothetical protein
MAFLTVADTVTRKVVAPGLVDGIFKSGPLLAYLRANALKEWQSSTLQENIIYGRLNGQFFSTGNDTHDISDKQIETGLTWTPRKAAVSVSADLSKLKVDYAGEGALYDYIDARMQVAALTMSEGLASAVYRDGQSSGRTTYINGLDEALSDGTTNGWTAQTFANYGTVARTTVSPALNSPMTGPTANVAGSITYPILEQAYNSVVIGTEEPNLIVTTNNGMSYIKMAFQAQQRFQDVSPQGATMFGFRGISFNGATILQDQYAPGAAGSATLALGQSSLAPSSQGETIWFLNVKSDWMGLWISNDDLFGFGFTGWKPDQKNLSAAGQYCFAGTFTVPAPRYHRVLFNVTG